MENELDNIEKSVSKYFNEGGWDDIDGETKDSILYDDLRNVAKEYVKKSRLRILKHIDYKGEYILDMASGPIQFKEYLEYSKNFNKRYCVDLSHDALEQAKRKIGEHGVFFNKSFFDINFEKDFFDCCISLHTIYHINKERQEEAVRKLISVTKTGCKVIIVYSNPLALDSILSRAYKRLFKKGNDLYFYAYPLKWWNRFEDEAQITILPWRSFSATAQKTIFPDNKLGAKMFSSLFSLEDKFPNFFVRFFQYPMIVLVKK